MLYKKLNVYPEGAHHERILRRALAHAESVSQTILAEYQKHWFFHNCHWTQVRQLVPNLVELKHKKNIAGKRTMKAKEVAKSHVDSVMMDIARKVAEEAGEDRFMQKINYARKAQMTSSIGGNIFLA